MVAHVRGYLLGLDAALTSTTAAALNCGKTGRRDAVAVLEVLLNVIRSERERELRDLKERGYPVPPGE